MRPGPGSAPGSTTSVPVQSRAALGSRTTSRRSEPAMAAVPTRSGVITCPARRRTSPARTSSPSGQMFVPVSFRTRTRPWPAGSVCSTITTASAPGGTGAPVVMTHAWPGPTRTAAGSPAKAWPTTSSSAGSVRTSCARTA